MALLTKRGAEIPEGAVALSEEEALAHQKNLVRQWPTETDVQVAKYPFFLKHGPNISMGTTFFTSGLIMNHFRNALNIRNKMYFFLLSPALFLPAYFSNYATEKLLVDDTLLMKLKCPLCTQMKYALIQAYSGIIFPTVYGLGSYSMLSSLLKTYDFKGITSPKHFWLQAFKFLKGATTTLQISGLIQTGLVLLLPLMQAKELDNITNKLKDTENDELLEC